MRCIIGVAGFKHPKNVILGVYINYLSRIVLERTAKESDSLVGEKLIKVRVFIPKYRRAREILRESVQTIG